MYHDIFRKSAFSIRRSADTDKELDRVLRARGMGHLRMKQAAAFSGVSHASHEKHLKIDRGRSRSLAVQIRRRRRID